MPDRKYRIVFQPDNITAYVKAGESLADAAAEAGAEIGRHCGGAGICGKCRVKTARGLDPLSPPTQREKDVLGEDGLKNGVRLACCAQIAADGTVFVIDRAGSEGNKILDGFSRPIEDWRPGSRGCGVSVDIGTTTVVLYLFDLEAHIEMDKIAFVNPQVRFGDDVISRIAFSSESKERLCAAQQTLVKEMNGNIGLLARRSGIQIDDITEITIAGNTVMEHLFCGVSPKSIGHSPYRPEFLVRPPFPASDVGIKINKAGMIKMLPNVAGYVGADIVAGAAALNMDTEDTMRLLVDIGTNNEIVIGNSKGMYCCAAAAGPALEGARIKYGMRACGGAVESVRVMDGDIVCRTIGGEAPKGLCGSGLIDAVALALREGVIGRGGRFNSPDKAAAPLIGKRMCRAEGGMAQLLLTDSRDPVYLTQKDIREVQLAVGAIKVGIGAMLEREGITSSRLEEVCLAGAFGNNINIESAVAVGLLPDVDRNRIRSVKNTSGLGASMALASADFYSRTLDTAKKMQYVELSALTDFQERFIAAIGF